MVLFIGNFPSDTAEQDLRAFFETYGKVARIQMMSDPVTRRGSGFGFVEMPVEDEAREALERLQFDRLGGRVVMVRMAPIRVDRRYTLCEAESF